MRIIFYHPVPIKKNASSASGIRPAKMLSAFRSTGFVVDEVCGYGTERKASIQRIKKNVSKGIHYSFGYGENTTLPFPLNEPSHVPLFPFLDYSFWIWLKKNKIPFGCFYRDIYWRFPEFRKGIPFHKWAAPLPLHYTDVYLLKKLGAVFFLPSEGMARFLPFSTDNERISTLPPGCDIFPPAGTGRVTPSTGNLNFFYVGGVVPPNYDMSPMMDFFSSPRKKVTFTLCCREKEWQFLNDTAICERLPSQNLIVIHKSGNDLNQYWENASVFLALWGETPYRDFAVPFKIFESIGHGVPVITTQGTAAGAFVKQNNFGWTIEPTAAALESLVNELITYPSLLDEKKQSIFSEQHKHTWEARARQAADILLRGETMK